MKYTKKDVTGMFQRLCKLMCTNGEVLHLDYAPIYGGYVIEQEEENGGVYHPFATLRRNAREMYLSMLMTTQALEDIKYRQEQLNKYELAK